MACVVLALPCSTCPIVPLDVDDGSIRRAKYNLYHHTLYIEPGSPWENGYNESFNGKLRD